MLTGNGTGTAANVQALGFQGIQGNYHLGVSKIQPEPFVIEHYPLKQVDIIFTAASYQLFAPYAQHLTGLYIR